MLLHTRSLEALDHCPGRGLQGDQRRPQGGLQLSTRLCDLGQELRPLRHIAHSLEHEAVLAEAHRARGPVALLRDAL